MKIFNFVMRFWTFQLNFAIFFWDFNIYSFFRYFYSISRRNLSVINKQMTQAF